MKIIKINKIELMFLFLAGFCCGCLIFEPKTTAYWFGFLGSLIGAFGAQYEY